MERELVIATGYVLVRKGIKGWIVIAKLVLIHVPVEEYADAMELVIVRWITKDPPIVLVKRESVEHVLMAMELIIVQLEPVTAEQDIAVIFVIAIQTASLHAKMEEVAYVQGHAVVHLNGKVPQIVPVKVG
jgi:hypothetical protein